MTTTTELKARAVRALRAGQVDDGIAAYGALLAVAPGDADSWYNLGYLLRCARRFEEAVAAYATALEHGIARPEEVRLNRAMILSEFLERTDEAEAELRNAIAIAPRFVAARLNLGNLLEDRGEAGAARAVYGDALAIDPRNGRALARQAAIDVFEGRAALVPERLRTALADARLPVDARTEIGFALGGALDAGGAYPDAFAAYAEANRAAAAGAHPSLRYDRAAHERLVDALIALPPSSSKTRGEAPVFVCGMFRSGSTLVEQILARHSQVTAGGELDVIPAMAAAIDGYPGALTTMDDDAFGMLAAQYVAETRALHPDAAMLTDKRPDNFLHIGLIKRMFPNARIVHTTRAPLDTMLSVYFLYFDDSITYGHQLGDIAHWYGQYRRLMAHWQASYPGDIHDVSYDDVVRAPQPTIAALLEFCGLPWEDGVLSPTQSRATVRTASVWQVRQPLHQRSSGRWRNYAAELRARRPELGIFAADLDD
ncbi:sulfotransferase [Sphingomonas sp. CFBP 13728]|uniref:sulfotransferase n=1 Tax=Sphingomonas sp. CFBP 13728 TaxID=2775294 RepID=UPI00177BC368|nr:sulfotransferase [Sphingomonas sp. CFBP 13728]